MDAKLNSAPHADAPAREALRPVRVRDSRDGDVPAMLAIYLHHIRRGVDPGVDRRRLRNARRRRPQAPPQVDEQAQNAASRRRQAEGVVVGYAYAVPFRKRPAYRYVVKHSIYVRDDRLHRGIGRQLMAALIDACAAAGFRQMIGYIDAANAASLKLHEAFGFRQVGYLPSIGYKFGRWTDTVMVQRSLGPGATEVP